ncbi:MAG: endonuclease/exonuclease/phosphatase family protein [Flavobacteriaceae bacterium]
MPILLFLLSFMSVISIFENTLEVVSYNIRYDNSQDGENQWDIRKETLASYLLKSSPDIIGMQEVLNNQLADLSNLLKEYKYVGVGREDGKTKGEYSPIFYRKSKLKVLMSSTFWLSETPQKISVGWDAALERICTYALFIDRKSKKQFWVFNTHFDHLGQIARSESVNLILEQISILNVNDYPIIVTGDLNLTPETLPIKKFQSNLNDVLSDLNLNDPKYGTFNGFDITKDANRRIDYIFQKGFRVLSAEHLWIKTPKGLWASDHHPVYLKCSF